MNANNFTQKSIEAINNSTSVAKQNGNQQITTLHLLKGLLSDADGLICRLIDKMQANKTKIEGEVDSEISRLPKVSGGGSEYLSNDFSSALSTAEQKASELKDEFISVEHLFYGLIDSPLKEIKEIFNKFNITKDLFLKTYLKLRPIVSQNGNLFVS